MPNLKIETKEPEKITGKSIAKSFYNILKYSNYKVLKCYKLVFRAVTFTKNAGSILTYLYFIGYIAAFVIFSYRKFIYLKVEIEKLFKQEKIEEKEENEENKENEEKEEKEEKDINNDINKDINNDNPVIYIQKKENNENNDIKKEDLKEKGKEKENNNIKKKEEKKNILKKPNKRKSDAKIKNSIINKEKDKNKINKLPSISDSDIDKIKNIILYNKKNISNNRLNILDDPGSLGNLEENKDNKLEINSKQETKNENEDLTDYELNDLEYSSALELDKRNFFKIYFYLLKREHIILFTFFNWNDFNIFSIKLSKFFLAIATDMAFNVFFFSDESMHNVYVSGGEHDFIGQLAQMIYSTIISQLLQIFINYLTMTDIQYYKIKELLKEKNINQKQTLPIMKWIKYKIIAFYAFTFILFLFFWYLISAFCAVYENTQRIFITDSITSFIMGLLYPFILYLAPAGLRILSLRKKKYKFLYSLSDKIPFF